MLYARIIVGIALLLIAAFGPGIGARPATHRRTGPDAVGQDAAHARTPRRDHQVAAVFILRILATMLGLWLLIFSIVQLLHSHGHPLHGQ